MKRLPVNPNHKYNKTLTTVVTEHQKKELTRICKQSAKSVSSVLREAVTNIIKENS